MSHAFSLFISFFFFACFICLFVFTTEREKAISWSGGENIGGDSRGKTVIRIYCKKRTMSIMSETKPEMLVLCVQGDCERKHVPRLRPVLGFCTAVECSLNVFETEGKISFLSAETGQVKIRDNSLDQLWIFD